MLQEYKMFVKNNFEKAYAREVTTASKRSTWYIFNCSAQFNGTSINHNLMQDPDLTNHLVDMLTWFRKEKIASSTKFVLFRVLEIYLAEEMSDLAWRNTECVRLFGAVSSPSCANYALKKTAKDNIDGFGEDAAETLRRNFYVQDILKSCKSSQSSIQSLQRKTEFHVCSWTFEAEKVCI